MIIGEGYSIVIVIVIVMGLLYCIVCYCVALFLLLYHIIFYDIPVYYVVLFLLLYYILSCRIIFYYFLIYYIVFHLLLLLSSLLFYSTPLVGREDHMKREREKERCPFFQFRPSLLCLPILSFSLS